MTKTTLSPTQGAVVAAVAFDDATEAVLDTAAAFAKTLGAPLRIVHACESLYQQQLRFTAADPWGWAYVSPELEKEDAALLAEAAKKVEALVAHCAPKVATTGCVLPGAAVDVLTAEALARRAKLIVTGRQPGKYGLIDSGLSTSVALMHGAGAPVVAVRPGAPLDLGKPALRILLADDLDAHTKSAVNLAYMLVKRIPGSELVHVNVRHKRQHGPEALWLAALRDRAAAVGGQHVSYRVVEGDAIEGVHRVAAEVKPDLVVFGRHQRLHARPFLIGRVPFRSMLAEPGAVMVVPPAGH